MNKKYFNSKITLVSFIIYLLITAFIFFQSLMNANDSSKQSDFVSNVISNTVEFFSGDKISLNDDGKDKSLYPKSISVSGLESQLIIGKPYRLTYELLPSNDYTLSEVKFTSSNEEIVKVNEEGLVSALKQGSATITVKDSFSGVKKSIDVTVSNEVYSPTLTFGNVIGFSNTDNNVYYSTQNTTGAIYAIEYSCDDALNSLQVVKNDDLDAVMLSDKIYFYPKRTGNVDIVVRATYQTSNGVVEKDFTYVLNVLEKTLPSFTTSLTINKTQIDINTNQTDELLFNIAEYSNGLEPAQKRLLYAVDSRALAVEKIENGLKLTPKKTSQSTVYLYSVKDNGLHCFEIMVNVLQGVPTNKNITTTGSWAVNGKKLPLSVTGDGKVFDFDEFEWTTTEGASVKNGNFYSEKNGSYTVTATHKTIDGFVISKTIEVKYPFTHYVRKIVGHFCLFLLLAIFATVVYYRLAQTVTPKREVLVGSILTFGAGLLTAGISEMLQSGLFVSGRAPQLLDVLIDFGGFTLGVLVALCIYIIYRKAKRKNKTRQSKTID